MNVGLGEEAWRGVGVVALRREAGRGGAGRCEAMKIVFIHFKLFPPQPPVSQGGSRMPHPSFFSFTNPDVGSMRKVSFKKIHPAGYGLLDAVLNAAKNECDDQRRENPPPGPMDLTAGFQDEKGDGQEDWDCRHIILCSLH